MTDDLAAVYDLLHAAQILASEDPYQIVTLLATALVLSGETAGISPEHLAGIVLRNAGGEAGTN